MYSPTLYMLVGVPGSGKSTWINTVEFDATVISTDNYIENVARYQNITYNEAFKDHIKNAEKLMYEDLGWAIEYNTNIVWDQTNISSKTRKKKLNLVPSHYNKIAVMFETPADDELERRLNSRHGKTIPPHVMDGMIEMLEQPTLEEGFDEVRVVFA